MAYTMEDIDTLIPNTTMQLRRMDGVPRSYYITPLPGYVVHDKGRDFVEPGYEYDEETGEQIEIDVPRRGYSAGMTTCGYNYAFTPVQIELDCGTVTAYGSREFCAVPASSVPTDGIFGGVTPPTETM